MQLDVHALLGRSAANGPGLRSVIWTQGCTLNCPACFNPWTHPSGGTRRTVCELVDWTADNHVDGLTISGGEPLQQAAAVVELARACRRQEMSVIVLTGYSWSHLVRRSPALVDSLRECVDVVLAGRYVQRRHLGAGLRGSANKTIELLSDRYTRGDIEGTPVGEVVIEPDGTLVLTGVDPVRVGRIA